MVSKFLFLPTGGGDEFLLRVGAGVSCTGSLVTVVLVSSWKVKTERLQGSRSEPGFLVRDLRDLDTERTGYVLTGKNLPFGPMFVLGII